MLDRPDDQRGPFERDRDRILYTSSLRRLQGITQVVSAIEGYVFHNRLTHTLEVAQIGRRLGQKLVAEQPDLAAELGVDPEVVEAAALAHDLGHPPFGHVGEEELDVVTRARVDDGFEGNAQTFRIVTRLAMRHEAQEGLRLTRATLNGILKYPHLRQEPYRSRQKFGAYRSEEEVLAFARGLHEEGDLLKSAEAELMDWADDIGYAVHDLEDFYRSGHIPLHSLLQQERDRKEFCTRVFEDWDARGIAPAYEKDDLREAFEMALLEAIDREELWDPYHGGLEQRGALRSVTSGLINKYLHALVLRRPTEDDPRTVEIDDVAHKEITMLKQLTWQYVIRRPALAAQQVGQRRVMRELFEVYEDAVKGRDLQIFPRSAQDRLTQIPEQGEDPAAEARVIVDVICAMTDQQALDIHARLTGRDPGSILNPILL